MPLPRLFGGELCFAHYFRQIPPGANFHLFSHEPRDMLSGKIPDGGPNRNRRFLHKIKLPDFMSNFHDFPNPLQPKQSRR